MADLIYDGNDLGFLLDEQGQGMPHFSEKFHAALAYEKCTRLGAALDIGQNLRCYDFVPKEEVEAFVEKNLESRGIEAGNASLISECMDRESYGKYLLTHQGYTRLYWRACGAGICPLLYIKQIRLMSTSSKRGSTLPLNLREKRSGRLWVSRWPTRSWSI